jgi:hypothetical protein
VSKLFQTYLGTLVAVAAVFAGYCLAGQKIELGHPPWEGIE